MRTHIIALIALVCTLASCGKKQEDPVKAAISNKISEQIGETSNIYFSSLALVDSTTFGEEIARRRTTLEIRRKQILKLAGQYEAAGKAMRRTTSGISKSFLPSNPASPPTTPSTWWKPISTSSPEAPAPTKAPSTSPTCSYPSLPNTRWWGWIIKKKAP